MESLGEERYENLSDELCQYGLTKNQAETYIALTRSSWASAIEVSKLIGKHHEEVYRAIDRLRELGLVSVMPGRPTRYLALPPEQGLSVLIERETQRLQDLRSNKKKLAERLESIRLEQKTIPEQKGFKWIADNALSASTFAAAIKEAKFKIALTLTVRELDAITSGGILKALLAAKEHNVDVQILTRVTPNNINVIQNIGKHFIVRHRGMIPAGLAVFDQSHARLVFQSGEQDEQGPNMIEIWSRNKRFVDCIISLNSELWESSMDIAVIFELIKAGSNVPHIELFKDRHAVMDLFARVINEASKDIYVLSNSRHLKEILTMLETSENVASKSVKVHVLTQADEGSLPLLSQYSKSNFDFKQNTNTKLVAISSGSRCIMLPEPDLLNEGIYVATGARASILGTLFKDLYDCAPALKEIKA